MRPGQRTFRPDNKEDRRTLSDYYLPGSETLLQSDIRSVAFCRVPLSHEVIQIQQ